MLYDRKFARCLFLGVMILFHDINSAKITNCPFLTNPKGLIPYSSAPPDTYAMGMQLYESVLSQCGGFNVNDLRNKSNSWLIFPGTKWCGQGGIAEHHDDLGLFTETDKCCRQHDNCEDYLLPGQSKHNLTNSHQTTRMKCSCDQELRKCFRDVNSLVSNLLGYIFFTVLHVDCYAFDHPIIRCDRRKLGLFRIFCAKYKLDKSKPKKWQWFEQDDWSNKISHLNEIVLI